MSNGTSIRRKIAPIAPAFQGHSRSSEPTWIDRLPMTSFLLSVVTMDHISYAFMIKGDFGRKLQIFPSHVCIYPGWPKFSFEFSKAVEEKASVMLLQMVYRILTTTDRCIRLETILDGRKDGGQKRKIKITLLYADAR